MKLATVTDEVLPDRSEECFPHIFETALAQGVNTFEIRMVEAKRYPIVEASAWTRMRKYGEDYGINFTTVSPGLFKTGLTHDLMQVHRGQLAKMSMDLAETINVNTLVTFGVLREATDGPDSFAKVVEIMRETAEMAAARGFTVQLENFPDTWADTAENCLALLEAVDHPAFGYVWDVGNLYDVDQKHFLDGYKMLKPYIRNVHLKDGQYMNGHMVWQHFGKGKTDIKGQIEALKADDYKGTLTVEAKCEPQMDEDFPTSLEYLRALL
ncbi:sugar phosphate isomerase/epimerase [Pacificibacter maritimus]|uniref:Sugar phosphate isomerase/epimerase n=1 Tax=Pacificibacter maritimus TaxID=762213 RepID=A0A3N4U789_9RHOB|nr:sugar phosphate isomerase/epimerase family protein [Pacificibacter maritimus]RPE66312.1 sugar phosphate isomerase/epimerase [Pacificibacter maritimus]